MRTNRHRLLSGVLAACVLAFSGATALSAPSAHEQALMKRVAVLWKAGRQAIKTVQCEYDDGLNGANRHVRYARDGEMYYHGSRVTNYDGTFGFVVEVAWDAQRSACRPAYGRLNYGSHPDKARPANPTPDDTISYFAERALGLVDDPENRCEFLDASETEYEGHPVVELRYRRVLDQNTVINRHGKDVGYWPVYELRTDPGGATTYELKDLKYARIESQGNELFYPVHASMAAYGGTRYPDATGNHMTLAVDERTLKINQPIPLSRFMITPWPSERIYDWDTEHWTEPTDPDWSPVGKVDFPWDRLKGGFEKAKADIKAANAKVVAAAPRPRTAAAPAPKAAVASPGSISDYLNVPLIGGLILLAGSGYWLYRRRRAA
jgi:hypothetical protein